MKKKTGFTLIELLATIVVLAIIILIATPIVFRIINSSKKSAYMKSASLLLNSFNLYYIDGQPHLENTIFNCNESKCVSDKKDKNGKIKEINVNGNIGTGKATVGKDGKISFDITNNDYCAYKSAGSDEIFIIDGTCEENNIEIIHDVTNPIITKTGEIVTSHTITINYEATDDIGIKEVLYSYGESKNKLDKQGSCSNDSCVISNLESLQHYYYKICAIDQGLNKSNPCITGSAKTKASIEGTPIITAQWPSTTSIKVDVSGMTIDESDSISYRYSINGEVKQDWTTDSSYTYSNLTEGTANEVLVETKATSGGDLGNNKEATIYTSKTVTDTKSGYTTNSECNNDTITIEESEIYGGIIIAPNCSSKTTTKSCSTTTEGYSRCSSSSTCYIEGIGNVTASRYDYDTEDFNCEWVDDETCEDVYKGEECTWVDDGKTCYTEIEEQCYWEQPCENIWVPENCDDEDSGANCGYWYEDCNSPAKVEVCEDVEVENCILNQKEVCEDIYEEECYDSSYESCDTYYTCYYRATKNIITYNALYEGVLIPKQTKY